MTKSRSTAVRLSLQVKTVLLSNIAVVYARASKIIKFTKFTLSAGTYSIDDFNAKVKVAVLQGRQDWELPQIKDLKLVIAEHYASMASSWFIQSIP